MCASLVTLEYFFCFPIVSIQYKEDLNFSVRIGLRVGRRLPFEMSLFEFGCPLQTMLKFLVDSLVD